MRSKTELNNPILKLESNYDWHIHNYNEYKSYKMEDCLSGLLFYYNLSDLFLYSFYVKKGLCI